jgi:hypothetical protein
MSAPSLLFVAEAGVNHNGEIGRAKAMVAAAVKSGAHSDNSRRYARVSLGSEAISHPGGSRHCG